MKIFRERTLHEFFEIGVLLKGANAALEVLLGALLLFFNVSDIVQAVVANELVEDPGDFLARHFIPLAAQLTPQAQLYGALYLLSHGIIKGFLVAGLLREKLWAYPASLGVLALFIAYQLIKIVETFSIPLIALTIFDLVVMWLIWHEYKHMKAIRHLKSL